MADEASARRDVTVVDDDDDDGGDGDERRASLAERLDFCGEKFDPLLALTCAATRPPVPRAKTFDNLAMFDAHVRRARTEGARVAGRQRQQVDDDAGGAFERRFQPHQMPVKSTKARRTPQDVFTRMAQCDGQEGVFGVLERARRQRLEVTVRIRHAHGVRGVLFGTVAAYDKFWNVALTNVAEYWIRRRKARTPAIGPPTSDAGRLALRFPRSTPFDAAAPDTPDEVRKLAKMLGGGDAELCRRRVNGLLVRGEQVVFIGVAQGRLP